MNLDALVAPLRADVVSGAAVIGRTASEVVRRAAERVPAADVDDFREALGTLAVKVLEAQPSMAPLIALTSRVLGAADGARELEAARRAAADAARDFREAVDSSAGRVAAHAAGLVPREGCTVMTLSNSSTVRTALEDAAEEDRRLGVICLESRPASEGKREAERLAESLVPVTYAVDAAAGALMERCDLVMMGADSIGDGGIVNKIGSRSLALLAREANVPVYVLADRTKLLPPGFPQPIDDDRPGEEVWRPVTAGIRVWNRYFESLPLGWAAGVVTEEGVMAPEEVESARSDIPVPRRLREWAAGRRSADGQ